MGACGVSEHTEREWRRLWFCLLQLEDHRAKFGDEARRARGVFSCGTIHARVNITSTYDTRPFSLRARVTRLPINSPFMIHKKSRGAFKACIVG